ncbi:unnamed protein product [Rotaria magnacalcarata]|uniref:MalT-like TPR region domain-containing protein n=1 Tax=Rotaria magnacalcarata TaxID=392030 RepID=A0A816T9R3_9BILA|nr:unnamed protein product [Rotaria magnacalcarata]CAF4142324.1 unnamed protein product [Rotaria magnacalcarata]
MLSKVKTAFSLLRIGHKIHENTKPTNEQIDANLKPTGSVVTSDEQRKHKNDEDITIILLNKNTNNEIHQSFILCLRGINDYVQVFHNEEDTLASIELILEEKILLIVDYLSDDLLKALETFKQVDSIFLYTSQSPGQVPSCITAICPTEQQLIDEISCVRQQLYNQMVVFSIYNRTKAAKFDLTQESGSFLFFQLFKAAFKRLPKNSESKKLMVSKYRNYYADNTKILKEITNFDHKYKPTEALRWYTHDSFIYRLINKALRTENISALCYFHFYINDLSYQLETEFIEFKKRNSKSIIIEFYRGFKTTQELIKHYKHNIGNLILTNGYLSTTRDRQLAYDLTMKQNIKSDEEKVLMKFIADLNLVKSLIFADISQHNTFLDQNEILFDLGTAFKIISCEYCTKEKVWLVNVVATDEGVDVASEYIEYQAARMTDSNIILTFGNLIIEIGDYDKAERYFEAILHSSIPSDEEIACIYYNIGRVYRLKGEYTRALEFLKQAYATHANARPSRLASAAKAMNAIGIVYMEQNHVQQAIDSFECALKLYAKTIGESHPDVGGTLINLANIYCEQEQFDEALSCFKRANYIYECHLPPSHPKRAVLLNNLGNLYYLQNQFDLALNAYQQALDINEAILPPNHPDIARNRHNLSMLHTIVVDQNKVDYEPKQNFNSSQVVPHLRIETIQINPFQAEINYINQALKPKEEFIEMVKY